ncbi:MAG: hypothetical protein CMP68_02030 [Flavobacteriales bacterium]|nr:hypothetical protein [Flavobacteriales bacterium]|tara:strand:+ start:36424 stop:36921 length:498 start_codon:yes stop_codon:yes gene_type:complete
MKNTKTLIACFFGCWLIQIIIFNQFLFNNWINPYIYILFILFIHPIKGNLFILMTSFSIGLLIDLGSNTLSDIGPIHGLSCLILGYFRPNFMKIISSRTNNLNDFSFNNISFGRVLVYISSCSILHHFLLFLFSGLQIINLLISTLLSSFFTILLLLFSYYIFKK